MSVHRDRIRPYLPAAARSSLGPAPRRIGLLGGSFNPAHDGHRQISLSALRRLQLDEIWWLVSPQNPLKASTGMAPLAQRMAQARRTASHPRIRITDIERFLGTRYTVDTVAALRRLFPATRFVWLMGADNLAQMARWKRWPDLCRLVPFAVLDRPGNGTRALAGAVARRYPEQRLDENAAGRLADSAPPAWSFIHSRLSPLSATALRARDPYSPESRRSAIPARPKRPSQPVSALKQLALASLAEDKAEDVIALDIAGRSSVADCMIVCSGRSSRQVSAIADHLAERLKAGGYKSVRIEGKSLGDWVLVDTGDVIVHIFRPEVRELYQLERLWTFPEEPAEGEPAPRPRARRKTAAAPDTDADGG